MLRIPIVAEGIRIALHGLRTSLKGPKRYPGSAEGICRTVVETCWDGRLGIFLASGHNYPLFYARDFGMCVDSLLALGHRERVRKTLAWAMRNYERAGKVTQIIRRNGKAYNYPDSESPDALAFLLHALAALGDEQLVQKHRAFLDGELGRFAWNVVDPTTGLVKRGLPVGGMRDYAIRDSSCYDNAMLAAISKYATALALKNPLRRYGYRRLLLERYWTGTHFKDDAANDAITGDANVAPLWLRVFSPEQERELVRKVQRAMREEGLDRPYALRYEATTETKTRMRWHELFTGSWERDTVWLHLGNLWLQVLARHDRKALRRELAKHRELIERVKHYPEVLDKEGEPYRVPLFHADDTMLWACNWLALEAGLRKKEGRPKVGADGAAIRAARWRGAGRRALS